MNSLLGINWRDLHIEIKRLKNQNQQKYSKIRQMNPLYGYRLKQIRIGNQLKYNELMQMIDLLLEESNELNLQINKNQLRENQIQQEITQMCFQFGGYYYYLRKIWRESNEYQKCQNKIDQLNKKVGFLKEQTIKMIQRQEKWEIQANCCEYMLQNNKQHQILKEKYQRLLMDCQRIQSLEFDRQQSKNERNKLKNEAEISLMQIEKLKEENKLLKEQITTIKEESIRLKDMRGKGVYTYIIESSKNQPYRITIQTLRQEKSLQSLIQTQKSIQQLSNYLSNREIKKILTSQIDQLEFNQNEWKWRQQDKENIMFGNNVYNDNRSIISKAQTERPKRQRFIRSKNRL